MGHDDSSKREIYKELVRNDFTTMVSDTCFLIIDDNIIKCQFDVPYGQNKIKSITPSYYKGSQGLAFVFDTLNKNTFDLIKDWLKSLGKDGKIPINSILIGVKQGTEISVTKEEIDQVTTKHNIRYFEISSEDDYSGIKNAFKELAIDIHNHQKDHGDQQEQELEDQQQEDESLLSKFKK